MSTRLGGRYQLVRELGAGGMGRVFQAVDTETGRAVAAKIMLATSEDNLDALLRFQQEGAVLSTLKHPNIVEVYGTFLEEHTSCIIMELLEGQSLSQILRAERLSLPRVKKLAEQTTSALAYAHGRAIVHRDIKPDNIMVVGDDHVKVTDFGIARILRTGATLNTATGMSIGTPLYMAPEQIEGQKVDGRADIYAFGAVMYQMVTGHPPFEGDDPLTIAFKHVHKEPRKPKELEADIPDDWEAVILKCLAKDPGERFQTATALHDAIAALSGGGASAAAVNIVEPVRPAPEPKKPDTIATILNPEITVDSHDGQGTVISPATPTGFNGATVIGPADAGQTVVGPADNGRTVVGPADMHTVGPIPPPDRTILDPRGGQTVIGPRESFGPQAGVNPVPQPDTRSTYTQPPPVVGPSSTVTAPEQRKKRPVPLIVGGGIAALLLIAAAVVAAFTLRGNGSTTPVAAASAPKVSVAGTKHGKSFASGQTVKVQLAGKADKYKVEVAKNSQFIAAKTYRTKSKSEALSVIGATTYYVKARAHSAGKWSPWSKTLSFAVAKPVIGKTRIVSPRNGTSTTNRTVHLAWSAVKGAVSYQVVWAGHKKTVRATSTMLSLKPGKYSISVAPQVKGAQLYTGAAAHTSITIKHKPKKKKVVQTTTSSTTGTTGTTSTGTTSGTTSTGTTGTTSTGTTSSSSTGTTYSGTSSTGTSSTGSGTTYSGTSSTGTSSTGTTSGTTSGTSGTGSTSTGSGSTSSSGTGSSGSSSSSSGSTSCDPTVQVC